MRLSAEKIKAAILDPDRGLRTVAVYYFAGARSTDPGLMPLVSRRSSSSATTPSTRIRFSATWCRPTSRSPGFVRRIDQVDADPMSLSDSSEIFDDLVDALCRADVELLERHAATIREVRQLDEDAQAEISNRIQLASLDPQALWQKLVEFCQEAGPERRSGSRSQRLRSRLLDRRSVGAVSRTVFRRSAENPRARAMAETGWKSWPSDWLAT